MTNDSPVRLPAEWEPNEYVLLSWPHAGTDWAYMLDSVRACFRQITEAICKYSKAIIVAPDTDECRDFFKDSAAITRITFLQMPTNDTWARDFGMICTVDAEGNVTVNDFKFNGWGLKFAACHDNLVTRNMVQMLKAPEATYANCLNFVLEGGSIDSDGRGTILTTSECLLSPNRNGASSRQEIEHTLMHTLGCSRVLWLDHGALQGDDTDSHIDTLARFLPGGVIAYTASDRPDDPHYAELKAMEQELTELRDENGAPYRLVGLPIPSPIYDSEGQRLPATYANFLIINKAVLVPIYADAEYDAIALKKIKAAMPLYDVVEIDCRALIEQHGSLHCMTMQIPQGALN